MAWYNPSTWTPVDNLQGQNKPKSTYSAPASEANNGPGSLYDPTSTFTGAGTDPRYLPGGQYYDATNTYSGYNPNGGQVLGATWTDPTGRGLSQSDYNSLVSGFNTQKQNIFGSANDAASALQPGYAQSILDTIHNLTVNQQGLDRQNVQNESSRVQAGRSILDMVGQGIKSGGVYLGNRNAGNSSAAAAIAQAYGKQGRNQMTQVGQQYAQNAADIGVKQQEQDYQRAQAPNKFHVDLMNNVNNIVAQARDKFAALDAQIANASLPDRIAIDQEKENVRSQVLGALQQYDAQLASGVGGIQAASRDTNLQNANQLLQAGQADPNLFQYTDQTPFQMQESGPVASGLPLFSLKQQKKQLA